MQYPGAGHAEGEDWPQQAADWQAEYSHGTDYQHQQQDWVVGNATDPAPAHAAGHMPSGHVGYGQIPGHAPQAMYDHQVGTCSYDRSCPNIGFLIIVETLPPFANTLDRSDLRSSFPPSIVLGLTQGFLTHSCLFCLYFNSNLQPGQWDGQASNGPAIQADQAWNSGYPQEGTDLLQLRGDFDGQQSEGSWGQHGGPAWTQQPAGQAAPWAQSTWGPTSHLQAGSCQTFPNLGRDLHVYLSLHVNPVYLLLHQSQRMEPFQMWVTMSVPIRILFDKTRKASS